MADQSTKIFKKFLSDVRMKSEGYFLYTPAEGKGEASIVFSNSKQTASGKQIIGEVEQLDDGALCLTGNKIKPPVLKEIKKAFKKAKVPVELTNPDFGNVSEDEDSDDDSSLDGDDAPPPRSPIIQRMIPVWPQVFNQLCSMAINAKLQNDVQHLDRMLRGRGVDFLPDDEIDIPVADEMFKNIVKWARENPLLPADHGRNDEPPPPGYGKINPEDMLDSGSVESEDAGQPPANRRPDDDTYTSAEEVLAADALRAAKVAEAAAKLKQAWTRFATREQFGALIAGNQLTKDEAATAIKTFKASVDQGEPGLRQAREILMGLVAKSKLLGPT
jgi:hypothetical protein